MHKLTIAQKLGLGKNFSWGVLHSRKNAVGIGLIKPKMAINMLACKLHIENKRCNAKIGKLIWLIEEAVMVEYGLVQHDFSKRISKKSKDESQTNKWKLHEKGP